MLSTLKRLLQEDARPLTEEPVVQNIRRAIRKKNPKKGIEGSYYSIYTIIQYVRGWGLNNTMPLTKLRDKCMMLLKIDAMARSADLEAIGYDTVSFLDDRVLFQMWNTKEKKEEGWTRATIGAVTSDIGSCTVEALKEYVKRTKKCKRKEKTVGEGKYASTFRPLFISSYPDGKIYPGIGKEAIAKAVKNIITACIVDDRKWTAHSIRGAASSKCYNLGCDLNRILTRGRWASSTTFINHYYRECTYVQRSEAHKLTPIETLLRMKADRVM
jgi:hypothetical protein